MSTNGRVSTCVITVRCNTELRDILKAESHRQSGELGVDVSMNNLCCNALAGLIHRPDLACITKQTESKPEITLLPVPPDLYKKEEEPATG